MQARTKAISDVLSSIKGVKMMGLTSKISSEVQQLRQNELEISKSFRKVQIANIVMGNTTVSSLSSRLRLVIT
jgi:dihydroorotate dehydrogenase